MKPFEHENHESNTPLHRRRLLLRSMIVLPLCLVCCTEPQQQAGTAQDAASTGDAVQGVWEVMTQKSPDGRTTEQAGPGQIIFTGGRYSAIYSIADGERPSSAVPFNPTAEEKAAQYDTIIANAGTYEISGSQLTFRPMIAKTPEFTGGSSTNVFRVDGDTLEMTTQTIVGRDGVSAANAGASMTLRRVR
jgi:hypothetical protein